MKAVEKENLDLMIPKFEKDKKAIANILEEVSKLPTKHSVFVADARDISMIEDNSVHLILTSPPYWNLKEYNQHKEQLGNIDDYEKFLEQIDNVWKECLKKLVVGGRMIVVVGDVLLSRRETGRHRIIPLHSDIQVRCSKLGFDNLAPIFWYKISNASFEVSGNSKFLGKPYEPNGIIKHDIEYILMLRKPGGYRKPTDDQRALSIISEQEFNDWYKQIWDIKGASTKTHPAPFPEELAYRLVRMFSFVGDTVMDPFAGSGTTLIAAAKAGRNSIGIDIDENYTQLCMRRLNSVNTLYHNGVTIDFNNLLRNELIAGKF
jgi:DNA modification methylase